MSPADLPLSLEAASVIHSRAWCWRGPVRTRRPGCRDLQGRKRSASASQTHRRRSSCDPPYRVSTRVLRGSLSFRSNLPLRCSRGRTLANSGLPEGEGDGGAPNRPGTRTSVHGPPRPSASGTSGKDGVAQHPLGPGARPSIPATPRRPGPPQYRHRGPASGHCGGDRDKPAKRCIGPSPRSKPKGPSRARDQR